MFINNIKDNPLFGVTLYFVECPRETQKMIQERLKVKVEANIYIGMRGDERRDVLFEPGFLLAEGQEDDSGIRVQLRRGSEGIHKRVPLQDPGSGIGIQVSNRIRGSAG